jgi:cytochrome c553
VSRTRRRRLLQAQDLSLWGAVIAGMALLMLWASSAASQAIRGSEIIERALAAAPDKARGAELYRDYCAQCHGRQAQGDPESVTPALAGQTTTYLIKQLADFVEGHRDGPEMHRAAARKEIGTPQAVRDLAAHVAQLPQNKSVQTGSGGNLALGARVFRKTCAQCHGQQGEGSEESATPALQRQHYSYLMMQMRQLGKGHRYAVDFEVMELLEALTLDELTAVADYASRLPNSAPEPIASRQPASEADALQRQAYARD